MMKQESMMSLFSCAAKCYICKSAHPRKQRITISAVNKSTHW